MKKYSYVARSPTGEKVKGKLQVENEEELLDIMLKHNYRLLKYKEFDTDGLPSVNFAYEHKSINNIRLYAIWEPTKYSIYFYNYFHKENILALPLLTL